jgi:hypothetical protein
VLKDIQILEDQKQESQRGYESAQLAKNYQLERKAQLDSKLSKIKYQNGAQRAENQRSSKELSIRHRELLDARGRSERSRKNISRFEAKMKRAIGVARLLPAFQNRVEAACIKLNESVTRMNFLKGQAASKSNAAIARRDDAKHRQELLLKSIHNNQQKERSITEEISKVRAEIAGNEADLSSAQQMESQTKLRVETIEHEIEMERNRHVEVMADIEAKNTEIDVAKIKARELIEERKVMIEAKKVELSKVWAMANAIRISEGQEALPEPKQWGIDHAPFLDVARIRSRVNAEEAELLVKKSERDSLHSEVEELEKLIQSNQVDATMKQEEAAALLKNAEEARAAETLRKEKLKKAVEDADYQCQEAEKVRNAFNDIKAMKEKLSNDYKLHLDKTESYIAAMQKKIESTLVDLESVEKLTEKQKEWDEARKAHATKELSDARHTAALIKNAFERAQREAAAFDSLPDDDLMAEMKALDEAEEDIINESTNQREAIIASELTHTMFSNNG